MELSVLNLAVYSPFAKSNLADAALAEADAEALALAALALAEADALFDAAEPEPDEQATIHPRDRTNAQANTATLKLFIASPS